MADNSKQWQEAARQILSTIDIVREYSALGLRVVDGKPNAKGWLEAHSYGLEDNTPSAGINVALGPFAGRYKDFRTGVSIGLFDFAAKVAGRFSDWKEARKHYASVAGVKLPGGDEESLSDRIGFSADPTPTAGMLMLFTQQKAGITPRAIKEAGGLLASWPKKLPAEMTNQLIAFPMYGSALLDGEPCAWHCTAQNPKLRVRMYQGEGKPIKHEDKITIGDYGLMNVDALNRLAEAEVVNICEGMTDMLAGQSVLGPWRDLDPENRKHVILSAGGVSYKFKPEWIQHFAGKEIRIWFDVGDGKNEGQIAAAVLVGALLPVAKAVRNIQLPLGKNGGKNDLRAWLCEGRNYQDMLTYAEAAPIVEPEDVGAQLSSHAALLKNMGMVVIGQHENSEKIEIYSEQTRRSMTIYDVDRLSMPKLAQYLGPEVVEKYVHDGKEAQPGKYQLKDVKFAIAAAASDKIFHSNEKLGAGVWQVEDQVVLVKAREVGLVRGERIEPSSMPFLSGRVLDTSSATPDWCDFALLNQLLLEAQQDRFCQDTFEFAESIFSKWCWRHAKAPRIVAALAICSWQQSRWPWRPQVYVTGNSDTGKSYLIEEVMRQLFGRLIMSIQKPTEAAIRQLMKHHSLVLFVDEFEHESTRQRVYELFRISSRGGFVGRGTKDQTGAKYQMKHIPWFSAVNTGLKSQPDRNRYIILDLVEFPPDQRGKIDLPSSQALADLGMRLLAIGLRHFDEAMRLANVLKNKKIDGVQGRVVESFSVPCGMFSAIYGHTDEEAEGFMQMTLEGWDFGAQQVRDDVQVLQAILSSIMVMDRGCRATVGEALTKCHRQDMVEYKMALERVGIRRVRRRDADKGEVVWFCTNVVARELLRNTEFAGHSIEQYLQRLKGAKGSRQRCFGAYPLGVGIPIETIEEIFSPSEETVMEDESYAQTGETGQALVF